MAARSSTCSSPSDATQTQHAGSSQARSPRTVPPFEVNTDRAAALAHVIAELMPGAVHNTEQYANNRIECDHRRLKVSIPR
jgi:transposase-like protein